MDLKEIDKKIENQKLAEDIKSISMDEVASRAYMEIASVDAGNIISYGYKWMDDRLGGIFPGQIVLIGGETGTGKTTFASSILYNHPRESAFFALESRLEDYGKALIYFEIGKLRATEGKKNFPYIQFIRGELKENSSFNSYFDKVYQEAKKSKVKYQDIKDKIYYEMIEERIKILAGQGIRLILIDHLHYFDMLVKDNSKKDEIERIMIRLQRLAVKTDVSILLVAHYRKLNGSKPTLDSFKDSMSISQNSSVVINLWRDREAGTDEQDKYKTKFLIPKSRTGGEGTIEVTFNPSTGRYKYSNDSIGTPIRADNYKKKEINFLI